MARDRGGFEQGRRKCPTTGKPLKLMSQPSNAAYRDGWERTFGKKSKKSKMKSKPTLTEKKIEEILKGMKRDGPPKHFTTTPWNCCWGGTYS